MVLIEVSLLPRGDDRSFSLVFRRDEGPSLTQGTYRLRHPSIGELALFLVPILPDEDGHSLYEAIFNRMTA